MVRRALSRSIKGTPPDEKLVAKYMLYWSKGELYRHPDRFPRIHSPALFGNRHPLDLEVGCGTGEYLCALAEQEPGVNFLGFDVWTKVVYRAVETAAEQALDNIKFIRAPFEFVYRLLMPDSLRTVYVHYPDPNIRSRGQHKLLNPTFLSEVQRALQPGGQLSIVSDHEELFGEVLEMVDRAEGFDRAHEERYLVGFDPPVKSRYQKLWEKHQVPPLRLLLKKQEEGI